MNFTMIQAMSSVQFYNLLHCNSTWRMTKKCWRGLEGAGLAEIGDVSIVSLAKMRVVGLGELRRFSRLVHG